MDPLIHTFVKLLCAIEEKEPCPEIEIGTPKDSGTWREQFVPRRVLSCGLSHWAFADGGDGKVMWANTPIKTQLIGRVISVACGRHHTLILTENGIYGAGDNSYGQLGVGAAWGGLIGDSAGTGGGLFYVTRTWQAPLADISAGHYHSAAIDVGGRLYTWGWGVHGQLGLGTIDDEWSPQLVTKLQGRKVINVSCGSCHTLALMKNGEVWAWGAGVFGQLGSGARDKASVPQRVSLTDTVDAIAAGYFHNLALTSKGHLYMWGASPQLIRAAHARRSLSPTEPASPPPSDQIDPHLLPALVDIKNVRGTIVQIAAGWHHSCLIDDTGAVYTWGLNFDGQLDCKRGCCRIVSHAARSGAVPMRQLFLGSGDRKQVCIPTEVRIDMESPPESMSNENLTSIKPFIALKTNTAQKPEGGGVEMNPKSLIACGGDFTVYVDEDGRVFVTGNMHQQTNRNDIEPHDNPLITLSDFKRKSWADEVILCLKRWIKEEYVTENKNIAAKLAYHKNMYPECLKYLLETLNRTDVSECLYLKHADDLSNDDGPSSLKREDVKATVNIVTCKRIKEIGLTILNEQPYPTNSALVLAVLPCCCDELNYLPRGITQTQTYFVHESGPLSVRASIVIDKCLKTFPIDTNLWETCFRIAVEYYLKYNLPVKDLEPILKKYMDKDITAMVSAIMFSNDCVQHSELFTPMFYLNMCSKLMDTWG
ncbi:X-linked retinitis pigmentosa GTPase regulator homolog [Eumeta japonica]|uniref:X-linked retinitis pigmentosa GTPase regulator homolog n=1 Tax=Eumeta variegata TaxID=151549 RepID=A0A4C1UHJ7_EUMVA|nr:X-linked retinitis pigmentosa GTPase regulator homolog [Eumeta japonica]